MVGWDVAVPLVVRLLGGAVVWEHRHERAVGREEACRHEGRDEHVDLTSAQQVDQRLARRTALDVRRRLWWDVAVPSIGWPLDWCDDPGDLPDVDPGLPQHHPGPGIAAVGPAVDTDPLPFQCREVSNS